MVCVGRIVTQAGLSFVHPDHEKRQSEMDEQSTESGSSGGRLSRLRSKSSGLKKEGDGKPRRHSLSELKKYAVAGQRSSQLSMTGIDTVEARGESPDTAAAAAAAAALRRSLAVSCRPLSRRRRSLR